MRTSASFVRLRGTDAAALNASAQVTFGACAGGDGAGAGPDCGADSTAACGEGGSAELHPANAGPAARNVNIVMVTVAFDIYAPNLISFSPFILQEFGYASKSCRSIEVCRLLSEGLCVANAGSAASPGWEHDESGLERT